jgi:tryptophan halogenase
LGAPLRTVTAGDFGWSSLTPVMGAVRQLTVYAPESEQQALAAHGHPPDRQAVFALGRRDAAWTGNCIAIGHAAGVVEPVTCAPVALLQRDINRLLTLIPVGTDMAVERREFNRQFEEDYRNAQLFSRALFAGPVPDAPYWTAASSAPVDERLAAKIEQFESRGLHVAYDLEPFSLEDWVILHFGMGRRPDRYDRIADRAPRDRIDAYLSGLRGAIAQVVATMPPHAVYRQNLANYLTQQGALVS